MAEKPDSEKNKVVDPDNLNSQESDTELKKTLIFYMKDKDGPSGGDSPMMGPKNINLESISVEPPITPNNHTNRTSNEMIDFNKSVEHIQENQLLIPKTTGKQKEPKNKPLSVDMIDLTLVVPRVPLTPKAPSVRESSRQAKQTEAFVHTKVGQAETCEEYVENLIKTQEEKYHSKFAFERSQFQQCIPNPDPARPNEMITV